ncbi:DUF2288 family protein [Synechococcus sp. PCC 7336]|uniref:DUF2288 family protein n=1 Tax=Synechococcus sp. PCC 7336 TaxID=195250 RepID=UPI0003460FD0|nr:DUF2288 family protein [Synechococcus sp. PCC 7336]
MRSSADGMLKNESFWQSGPINKALSGFGAIAVMANLRSVVSDVRALLAESMAPAEWGWLRSHALAGRMVVVSRSLDLLDVGEAIATDNTEQVKNWLDAGLAMVADQAEIDRRDRQSGKAETIAAIVQPFVLVPELEGDR